MDRKLFLKTAGITLAATPLLPGCFGKKHNNFFKIEKVNNRFFLICPSGNKFFSIGINHIDSATLRYNENVEIWMDKYNNSMETWLKKGVAKHLKKWEFNTVGWNQEVVTRHPDNHRHSRSFTPEEYGWLDMPYCHMLPFADFHWWENETRNPDFFSKGFEDWCDYVARDEVARLADDSNLLGYFYIDCPTWTFTTKANQWKGPLFDPDKLKSDAGKKELFQLATRYYKVTGEAVKRYDKNHLILGDRYWAKMPIPDEVVQAATPFVDIICFQDFSAPEKIARNLNLWHSKTGKPTLIADCSHTENIEGSSYKIYTPGLYEKTYQMLKNVPSCVGFHLCGAYLENRTRKYGLMDENENPNNEAIMEIVKTNSDMKHWVDRFNG